jgi:hypothetical protein
VKRVRGKCGDVHGPGSFKQLPYLICSPTNPPPPCVPIDSTSIRQYMGTREVFSDATERGVNAVLTTSKCAERGDQI